MTSIGRQYAPSNFPRYEIYIQCREMWRNAEKCRELHINGEKCREMSYLISCIENIAHVGSYRNFKNLVEF